MRRRAITSSGRSNRADDAGMLAYAAGAAWGSTRVVSRLDATTAKSNKEGLQARRQGEQTVWRI